MKFGKRESAYVMGICHVSVDFENVLLNEGKKLVYWRVSVFAYYRLFPV